MEATREEASLAKQEAYLAENAKRPGVTTLPSGLQYEVMVAAHHLPRVQPNVWDECVVHYTGTLIDGTEFDSSHKRGKPGVFSPNAVIRGWTEALQLMATGDRWKLYIPSILGYGPRGKGTIPGNAVLIFDMELLEVRPVTSLFAHVPIMNITVAGSIKSGWFILVGATFVGGFFVYGICSFYLEHLADRRAAKAAEDAAGESSTLCDNADATQSSGLRSRKNASERWLPRAAQNDHVWRAVSVCVACR